MDPREVILLKTYVPITFLQITMIVVTGLVLISAIASCFFWCMRRCFQCCLEKPGENRLSPFSVCKKEGGKYRFDKAGCGELCGWSFLSIMYLCEGTFVVLLAFFLTSFFIAATAFNAIHLAIPFVVLTIFMAFAITHACRERNLLNAIHGREIANEEFADYGAATPEVDAQPSEEDALKDPITVPETSPEGEHDIVKPKLVKQNCFQATVGNYFDSIKLGLKKKLILYIILLFIGIMGGAIVVMFTNRMCLCEHPYDSSSQLSRLIRATYDPSCPEVGVCYSYVLLPENPNSEMIIKFHTRVAPFSKAVLLYDTISYNGSVLQWPSTTYQWSQVCTTYDASWATSEETKFVHTCDLKNLNTSTTYYFTVAYDSVNTSYLIYPNSEKKFKTLPSDSSTINFVTGGDKTISTLAAVLYKQAAAKNPHFFAIGGDIAYADGFSSCYRRWDDYFKEYSTLMVTPDGHSVPLLSCLGNHEANSRQFNQPRTTSHDYIVYFSHALNRTGVDRPLYHIHKLGDYASIVSLDSGVVTSYSESATFLKSVWATPEYVNTKKFAMYHAPLYPSIRSKNGVQAQIGRAIWGPIFDSNNLVAAFENHDHALKRTKKIRADNWSNGVGTVYVGDGSFGTPVEASNVVVETKDYLAYTVRKSHLWNVQITPTTTTLTAFDETNTVLDSTIL